MNTENFITYVSLLSIVALFVFMSFILFSLKTKAKPALVKVRKQKPIQLNLPID